MGLCFYTITITQLSHSCVNPILQGHCKTAVARSCKTAVATNGFDNRWVNILLAPCNLTLPRALIKGLYSGVLNHYYLFPRGSGEWVVCKALQKAFMSVPLTLLKNTRPSQAEDPIRTVHVMSDYSPLRSHYNNKIFRKMNLLTLWFV